MQNTIKAFVINLEKRTDRKDNVLKQFKDKAEFDVHVVKAIENKNGALGLWLTIKQIIAKQFDEEYVLICEDDHEFTRHYSKKFFFEAINEARKTGANILLGGVSWVNDALQISKNLFWLNKFTGLQFTVIFKKSYDAILAAELEHNEAGDLKLSILADNKLVMYPFISKQKEFGYSDATQKNNEKGFVDKIFKKTAATIGQLAKVNRFYKERMNGELDEEDLDQIAITTFVINLPHRKDRLEHILAQFKNKNEFDVKVIEACENKIGAVGLWQSIVKIVNIAIKNDEDVIIICEDDHQFSECYSKTYLLKNILEGYHQGVELLSGGIGGFEQAVPVAQNRYWINSFFSTQFLVLYKNIFQKIIDEPYDNKVTADGKLSEITSHKMVIHPFLSTQKEFGYSDVTSHNNGSGSVNHWFISANDRLNALNSATELFKRVGN